MKPIFIVLFTLIFFLSTSFLFAANLETIHNSSFEDGADNERPAWWYLGFPEEPLQGNWGTWAIDNQVYSEGTNSLRLTSSQYDGYFVVQIADGNANLLKGTTVTASVDVKLAPGAAAQLAVFAINEEEPLDPDYQARLAGKLVVTETDTGGEFKTISGSFVASAGASHVAVILSALTEYNTWFDKVSVKWDQPDPGTMPDAPEHEATFETRNFGWGFTNESPANYSEYAQLNMVDEMADLGADRINLFTHVRYNQLAGLSLLDGFDIPLRQSARAEDLGLSRILTFDFTHNSYEGIGDLNPMPDGNSPGDFSEASVQNAMQAELLALADKIDPLAVLVGIEIDFFYEAHPEWWDDFVSWYQGVRQAIKQNHPNCLVSVYVTLDFILDEQGEIREENKSLFEDLMNDLDFLGYSAYYNWSDLEAKSVVPGMFNAIRDLNPDLPIALPEFGINSTEPKPGTPGQDQEYQVELLMQMLDEIVPEGCAFATLYSLYDQTYFGWPSLFQEWFSHIGVYEFDSSPKLSAAWFTEIANMNEEDDDDDEDDNSEDDDDNKDDNSNNETDDDEEGCGC